MILESSFFNFFSSNNFLRSLCHYWIVRYESHFVLISLQTIFIKMCVRLEWNLATEGKKIFFPRANKFRTTRAGRRSKESDEKRRRGEKAEKRKESLQRIADGSTYFIFQRAFPKWFARALSGYSFLSFFLSFFLLFSFFLSFFFLSSHSQL